MAPDAGSLLHGYVTAISKSAEKRLETIKQPANGACGLQVWKVAQLVEQEAITSPRFDSWLSDLTRKNYKLTDCGKHFQHKASGSSWVPLLCGEGDAVRCTWLISSDCGLNSYSPYLKI